VEPLIYEEVGRFMLMGAFAMIIIGFLWIWKIVSIRV
jgi:Flp pilus assembly protein TadB